MPIIDAMASGRRMIVPNTPDAIFCLKEDISLMISQDYAR